MSGKEMMSHEDLMQCINEVSFAVNDMQLYLDTHPDDTNALGVMQQLVNRRKKYKEMHMKYYGPLTVDCTADACSDSWLWILQPMPWEIKKGRC